MRVVVTGAAGFIGARLAREIAARGALSGQRIGELVLVDRMFDASAKPIPGAKRLSGDLSDERFAATLFERPPAVFFHLAATLTAEAEADFDKGARTNLFGTLALLDACRSAGRVRFVFSSSMAAFGGALPDVVHDELPQRPQTSYGAQKVITELLLDDYTRRGFLDGRGLRLPVVLLRLAGSAPALSEHISAFVREPLLGRRAVCPFRVDTRMPVASVGAVARALVTLCELPSETVGPVRTMNLPALSVTVADMVAAVERRAGREAQGRLDWRPDARLQGFIDAMPKGFTSQRALDAGIRPESSFDDVIDDYLANAAAS